MKSEKNIQIAVEKSLPKLLSLEMIFCERASQYQSADHVIKEFKKMIPKPLLKIYMDFNSKLIESISPDEEGFEEKMDDRFNMYLRRLGLESLDVAESVVDPSLERLDKIVAELTEILTRYLGANPFPVLKGKLKDNLPFAVIGGNLEHDEYLEKRADNVEHVLAKEGKTLESVENMSLEDIMKIRKQVQKREKTQEPREFYEQEIAKKYAEYAINLSKQITPEKLDTPDVKKFFQIIWENLPKEMPDSKRKKVLEEINKGSLAEYLSLGYKLTMLKTIEEFVSNSIDMDYINSLKHLVKLGGIDVEMDGKITHVTPLGQIDSDRKALNALKKMKDYLVDAAMEKGLESSFSEEKINEAIRFSYGNNKEDYIQYFRLKQRLQNLSIRALTDGKKLSREQLKTDPIYQHLEKMIDDSVYKMADMVFGSDGKSNQLS